MSKKSSCPFLICLILLSANMLLGAQDFRGLPLISNYSPDDYRADTQNWAAVQDKRGILYVANNSGVLEFDGQEWRLIRIAENLYPRSLACDAHGRIYVGAMGDIGYLEPQKQGELTFVSLTKAANIHRDTIGDILTTVACGDAIIFASPEGLFSYSGGKLRIIRPKSKFHLGFSVNGHFYIRQRGLGLFELLEDQLQFVPGSERFAEDRVYTMMPVSEQIILLGSRDNGLLYFNPAAKDKAFMAASEFNDFASHLQDKKVTGCERLANGNFVFATMQSGFYLVSVTGRLIYHINKATGLLNDCIYYVYTDSRGHLVLCLSVGISYVETGSPFTFLNEKAGINGMGNTLFRHSTPKGTDTLYLGTYQGLFYREMPNPEPGFQQIPGSTETWCLHEDNGNLLYGSNSGVGEISGKSLNPIIRNRVALSILKPRRQADQMLIGTIDGLMHIQYRTGKWHDLGLVKGFSQSSFGLYEDPDGTVWLHTNTGNGVLRLTLSADLGEVSKLVSYTEKDGLPSAMSNVIFPGKDRFYLGTTRGLYRFNHSNNRFEPDPDFPETQVQDCDMRIVHESGNGDVWLAGSTINGVFRRQAEGKFKFESGFLNRLRQFRLGEFMSVLDDHNAFVSYQDGFIHFDPLFQNERKSEFRVMIRMIEAPEVDLFSGTFYDDKHLPLFSQSSNAIPVLTYKRNMLRFTFAAPFFEGARQTEYSYQLLGFDKEWSGFGRKNTSSYTNLPEGDYTFMVKSRNIYGETSATASFRFTIKPPWTRTLPAYLAYLLLLAGFIFAIVKFYSRHLVREKLRLEALVSEKTRELKETSLRDPLTGLRNRRFITEIVEPELRTFLSFKKYLLESNNQRSDTTTNSVFGIFLLDLDHFKAVNDSYGHEAGDRVLKQFSAILREAIREDDFCIRWGGEEFLIILRKTSPEYIDTLAHKIRAKVADTDFFITDDHQSILKKTVSIGYAVFPFYQDQPERLTYEQIIMLADLGLYYSKKHGRNLVVRLEPGPLVPTPEQLYKFLTSLEFSLHHSFLKITPN